MQSTFDNNRFANVSVLSQQQNGSNLQGQSQAQSNPISGQSQSFFSQPQTASSQQNSSRLGLQSQIPSTISSSFQTSSIDSSSQKDPSWFSNPRKRAIPQTIVKRSLRQQSANNEVSQSQSQSSSALTNKSGFNTMSFGSGKNQNMFNASNIKSMNADSILGDSNEAPPMISIHDWQREDQYGSMPTLSTLPTEQNEVNSQSYLFNDLSTSKTVSHSVPNSFKNLNAFDKKPSNAKESSNLNNNSIDKEVTPDVQVFNKNEKTSTGSLLFPFFGSKNNSNNSTTSRQISNQPQETAVIVFGYPESISNLILTHFSHFGSILEDFEVLKSSSGINVSTLRNKSQNSTNKNESRKYPIFTGEGWVKVTYDSHASAARALQENGIIFSGSLIGCIPYSKNAVEQLASCKIDKIDNIGESDFSLSATFSPSNKFSIEGLNFYNKENILSNPQDDDKKNMNNSNEGHINNSIIPQNVLYPNHKLTIKDGKSLFVHNANSNNHNFLQSLENKMRQQQNFSNQNNQNNGIGVLHTVNNWLFGWNNL